MQVNIHNYRNASNFWGAIPLPLFFKRCHFKAGDHYCWFSNLLLWALADLITDFVLSECSTWKKRAKVNIIIAINTQLVAMPITCTVHFIINNCLILCFLNLFVASSALSTTPSSTTLSGASNETPKNVRPTTRTTAASSTEKPMISHSASGKLN